MNADILQIRQRVCGIAPGIVPSVVRHRYGTDSKECKLDDDHSALSILHGFVAESKPVIAFVGAFSSGKTYLISYLTGTDVLISEVLETTAVITVVRHLEDRPLGWDQTKTVFALRAGSDPRSMDPSDVAESAGYEDLERLTTYRSDLEYDVVVVFLESTRLKNSILLDCPGVGTAKQEVDSAKDAEGGSTPDKIARRSREHSLQATAVGCADGFVVLSSALGTGMFADSNTKHVMDELVKHIDRFRSDSPHGNVLLVGSHADPRHQDLSSDEEVLRELRRKIIEQWELIPKELRQKLNPRALSGRVVLFYQLHPQQAAERVSLYAQTLRAELTDIDDAQVDRLAFEQFERYRPKEERVIALTSAFDSMINGMSQQIRDRHLQEARDRAVEAVGHFEFRRAHEQTVAVDATSIKLLSSKFENEFWDRRIAFDQLKLTIADRVVARLDEIGKVLESRFDSFADSDNLQRAGGEKSLYSRRDLYRRLDANLRQTGKEEMTFALKEVEAEIRTDLRSFDLKFLPDECRVSDWGSFSVLQSLPSNALTHACGAAVTAVAEGPQGVADMLATLLPAASFRHLGAFGKTVTEVVSLLGGNKTSIFEACSKTLSTAARDLDKSIQKTLDDAKATVDSRIDQIHARASGIDSARHAAAALEFYEAHYAAVVELRDALRRLAATWIDP